MEAFIKKYLCDTLAPALVTKFGLDIDRVRQVIYTFDKPRQTTSDDDLLDTDHKPKPKVVVKPQPPQQSQVNLSLRQTLETKTKQELFALCLAHNIKHKKKDVKDVLVDILCQQLDESAATKVIGEKKSSASRTIKSALQSLCGNKDKVDDHDARSMASMASTATSCSYNFFTKEELKTLSRYDLYEVLYDLDPNNHHSPTLSSKEYMEEIINLTKGLRYDDIKWTRTADGGRTPKLRSGPPPRRPGGPPPNKLQKLPYIADDKDADNNNDDARSNASDVSTATSLSYTYIEENFFTRRELKQLDREYLYELVCQLDPNNDHLTTLSVLEYVDEILEITKGLRYDDIKWTRDKKTGDPTPKLRGGPPPKKPAPAKPSTIKSALQNLCGKSTSSEYAKLTKPNLVKLCEDRSLTIKKKDTKADLITALEQYDASSNASTKPSSTQNYSRDALKHLARKELYEMLCEMDRDNHYPSTMSKLEYMEIIMDIARSK